MNNNAAIELLKKLEEDKTSAQNFIAQADSRYILFKVNEPIENFPKYTEALDDRLLSIAYTYLSIGCSFAENQKIDDSIYPLEKGARILHLINEPQENRYHYSKYFMLTSALGYYASFQYSKAFIILKDIEEETDIARLFSYFLRREYKNLTSLISNILLDEAISSDSLSTVIETDFEEDYKIHSVLLAKSISLILEYVYTGEKTYYDSADRILSDLKELLIINEDPAFWWTIRIFKIIINGLYFSSLWHLIPPKIENDPNKKVSKYIHTLTFQSTPVIELFVAQRSALNKVLNEEGSIVSFPTSSGKTRVAEIAILECLTKDPDSLILYLAPFRSLAHEIEITLNRSFPQLGFDVSHLYGGSQFSKLDKTQIEESSILIATPEKVKAILRSDPSNLSRIKLVIIDEGHLLGATERYITNELFFEELKVYLRKNMGRIILLSAVLPNSKEIAKWITGDETNTIISTWRPSSQRFGLLKWTGKNVDIDWKGEIQSYNKNFIEPFEIIKPRSSSMFPSNKREAVALTAIKLTKFGSVLIFVGRKSMIKTQANDIITSMGKDAKHNIWINRDDWETFNLACKEAYDDSNILNFAKYGIICHSRDLPSEVRQSMEKLMRNGNPKVIISTTTLAQGVNIGPSSVIIANAWITNKPIDNNGFWNIAGRAGRAFIDVEGKILFAVDQTAKQWQIRRDINLAENYFDILKIENANSGLLTLIKIIFDIALKCKIDFNLFLQMIADNDYSKFTLDGKNYEAQIADAFDWIDDTLLALNLEFGVFSPEDPIDWIDDVFRNSLAIIQCKTNSELQPEEIISFIKARTKGVLKIAGDPNRWSLMVSSGLPLRSVAALEDKLTDILEILKTYNESSVSIGDLVILFEQIESIITELPSSSFSEIKSKFPSKDLEIIRKMWMAGTAMKIINKTSKNAHSICQEYYGYTLPWAINGLSKVLRNRDFINESKQFEEFAVISELGVPSFLAAKIYLAGIKSRVAATELADYFNEDLVGELSLKMLRQFLTDDEAEYNNCSIETAEWLRMFIKNNSSFNKEIKQIPDFKFKKDKKIGSNVLNIREHQGHFYLCSPDYNDTIVVENTDNFPFQKYVNDYGIFFNKESNSKPWKMLIRNPALTFKT